MRAQEFLAEYDRAITAQKLGPSILNMFKQEGPAWIRRALGRDIGNEPDQNIINDLIQKLELADPTPNKQYVPWMARIYSRGGYRFEDVLSQMPEYLEKFYQLVKRKKIPAPRNDINGYQHFGDLMGVVDEYPDIQAAEIKDKGNAELLYQDSNLRAIIPFDQTAACYYGQNTKWCTAATKGYNYFNEYAENTPLVIVIPTKPQYPGEKYQLHFDYSIGGLPIRSDDDYLEIYHNRGEDYTITNTSDGQFMNEKDQPVSLKSLKARFGASFDQLIDAYLQKFPDEEYRVNHNFLNDRGRK